MNMSENTITASNAGNQTAQEGAGGENPSAEGSRTFTQDEVNSLLAKERRSAESRYAGYEDFKAKAEEFEKLQEANKTELEKANERLAKANTELEALKAEKERAEAIAAAAKEHGVDADMLSRMAGDVEENALFLKERAEAAPKYPSVPDEGSAGAFKPEPDKDWLRAKLEKK